MNINFTQGKISLVLVPTDMRGGFDRLALIAGQFLKIDISKGEDWVVFISRKRHVVKIIHADPQGSLLITRKLHHGSFQQLMSRVSGPAVKSLSADELMSYLDGEALEVKRTSMCYG